MSLYLFNNQQKINKILPYNRCLASIQTQEINKNEQLVVEIPHKDWETEEKTFYLAVGDQYERFLFHMYKIISEVANDDSVEVTAIQIGYDELKAYGYVKDRRFQNNSATTIGGAIVEGTDWEIGYVSPDLPNASTNFYYISRLEALSKLIAATGCEVQFRVEITGNRIVSKRLNLYKQLGTDEGKRFAYGSALLSVTKEEDNAELYTALVGRGKGEETDAGGFGRRIRFDEIAWSKTSGNPVDKPAGQEFVEIPEMTALYGYSDGSPRIGIIEFTDTEDPELLLEQTYNHLVNASKPKIQFKSFVQNTGDMKLGETVSIIRDDIGFKYKTRVFKVTRDLLNNNQTSVEFGDKITQTRAENIKKLEAKIDSNVESLVTVIQTTADGKNKIFRGGIEPTDGMTINDLWYKPVGDGETELYTWNGVIWELVVSSAVNNEVTLKIGEAKDIADTAKLNTENIATDLDVGTSFYKHTSDIGLASKNLDGTVNSIINLGSDGTAYIGGENIVLDGDTVVDGTFTVTDTFFAPNMSIDKFTTGTLNAANVNLINLNVDKLVGNMSEFIQSGWNAINSRLSITGLGLKIATTDSWDMFLGNGGITVKDKYGNETGSFFALQNPTTNEPTSVGIVAEKGYDAIVGFKGNNTGSLYYRAIGVDGDTGKISLNEEVSLNDNLRLRVADIFPNDNASDSFRINTLTTGGITIRSNQAQSGMNFNNNGSTEIIGKFVPGALYFNDGDAEGVEIRRSAIDGAEGFLWGHTNSNNAAIFFADNGNVWIRSTSGYMSRVEPNFGN